MEKTGVPEEMARTTEAGAGYFLRWSRMTKSVQVASTNAGVMGASSISQPTLSSPSDSNVKVILDSVSGYAAQGELLAIMGPVSYLSNHPTTHPRSTISDHPHPIIP
jgi:hypothetical protein